VEKSVMSHERVSKRPLDRRLDARADGEVALDAMPDPSRLVFAHVGDSDRFALNDQFPAIARLATTAGIEDGLG